MDVKIYPTTEAMGKAAAEMAVEELSRCIAEKGKASFMAATGASQFAFLEALTKTDKVDWAKTTMFHLDEYIGIPADHPAAFRRYLRERLIDKVHPGAVNLIDGSADDPAAECERLSRLVEEHGIDVAFVGIGENGHLGFNDPPADFNTDAVFHVARLNDTCRQQQVGEGWFETVDDVPEKAITISIPGVLKAKRILCIVPEERKAEAVKGAVTGPVSPDCPSSAMQHHPNTTLLLDKDSASLLDEDLVKEWEVKPGGCCC